MEGRHDNTQLLENRLANVLVKQEGGATEGPASKRYRAFSHVASTPQEVSSWVPVTLPELGDTVYFDARSCEAMRGRDFSVYVAQKRRVPFVHAVRVGARVRPAVEVLDDEEAGDEAATGGEEKGV